MATDNTKTDLIPEIVKGIEASLKKLLGENDTRVAAVTKQLEKGFTDLKADELPVRMSGLQRKAVSAGSKAAVAAIVPDNGKIADLDAKAIGDAVVGKTLAAFASGLPDDQLQSATTAIGKITKTKDDALTKLMESGKNLKVPPANGFEKWGVTLGAAFIAVNRLMAVFKPKKVMNENGEEEKVSKPWYSKVGNLLLACGFGVLAFQVGAKNKSTMQALNDMAKPVFGKWTASIGAKETPAFSLTK